MAVSSKNTGKSRQEAPPPNPVRGDLVSGRAPSHRADPNALPRLPVSEVRPYAHPFLYQHHPGNWEFVVTKKAPEGEWLPSLKPFRLMPGANRVRTGGAMNLAQSWLKSCRFLEIPRHHGPGGDYVREFDVLMTPKGVITSVHFSAWDHLRVNDGATERVFDFVGYRAWLRMLLATHVVPPPKVHVLRRTIQIKEQRIDRLSRLPADNPVTLDRIKREGRLLDLMRGSFCKQFGYNPSDLEAGYEQFASELAGADMPNQDDESPVSV